MKMNLNWLIWMVNRFARLGKSIEEAWKLIKATRLSFTADTQNKERERVKKWIKRSFRIWSEKSRDDLNGKKKEDEKEEKKPSEKKNKKRTRKRRWNEDVVSKRVP